MKFAAPGVGTCLLIATACSSPASSASSNSDSDATAPLGAGGEGGADDPATLAVDQDALPPEGAATATRSDASLGADADGSPTTVPPFDGEAAHPPLPVIAYAGGSLLTAVNVVTVTFAGDPLVTDLESFGASVASSSWWDTVRAGYCDASTATCVGDGPPGTAVRIATAPAASYTDSDRGGPSSLQDWLSSAIATALLPPPDANATSNILYVIYLPKTTKVTLDGFASCISGGFDGYHSAMLYKGKVVPYAVVVECDPTPRGLRGVPLPSVLQNTTVTASHEILESATDPVYLTGYAGDQGDLNDYPWADVTGGLEAGDLCLDPFLLNQDQTLEGPFAVQRIWSNASAAAGLDPCVPAPPGEVYFGAAPARSFFVLDVGQSVTFEVDAFSTGPMSPWLLTLQDFSSPSASYLRFRIAGAAGAGTQVQVANGSKIEVTATLLLDPAGLLYKNAYGGIVSAFQAPGQSRIVHYWPIGFMSSADAADAGIDASGFSRARAAALRQGPRVNRLPPRPLP